MAKIRLIQELAFDGVELFCPQHPNQTLMPWPRGSTKTQRICFASLDAGGCCWKMAEWPSEDAMWDELGVAGT